MIRLNKGILRNTSMKKIYVPPEHKSRRIHFSCHHVLVFKYATPSIVGVVDKSIIFFYLVEYIFLRIYRKNCIYYDFTRKDIFINAFYIGLLLKTAI